MARGKKKDFYSYLQMQRERLRVDNPVEAPFRQVRTMQDIMPKVIKKTGSEDKLWEKQLLDQWSTIVGDALCRHTRPGRMQARTLTVFVTHSTWLQELSRFHKETILKKLQDAFGENRIRRISLQLDPDMNQPRR